MNQLPPWLVALMVVAGAEIFAIGLMLLTRLIWGTELLSLNNEVAGFKFAVVGVLYAVLLAFVVIAVWENYENTESTVRGEAKAVIDLHHISYALPEPGGGEIRKHLASYLEAVRESEWPAMARGEASDAAARELIHLSQAIFDVEPRGNRELALYQQILRLLTTIEDDRNERLDSSDGTVPPVLWVVLVAGGLITLGYPAFFGSPNIVAQCLMTAALAALVAIILLLGVVLDFPFVGEVHISALPFDQALEQMPAQWPPP
jgi:Protein of unknown function (DUF4239)